MKTEPVLFETPTPYPNPVSTGDLLTGIEAVIRKHVILNDHAAAALAVWVLHTHTFQSRDAVAYVALESPEKRCGKTTLLTVLAAMACKPLIASNITTGALFRAIHSYSPTLFIDEADAFLAGNGAMRGIINSGNTRRTAFVLRLAASARNRRLPAPPDPAASEIVETGINKYSCWCPKVIAMIGHVPDTIADRSIVVKMARKLTTEPCAPLSELDTADIKSKCARFALDSSEFISQSPRIHAGGLNDRAADTFDPLFVIARLAGPAWEQKLAAAALALSSTTGSENSAAEVILDVLEVFAVTGCDKIFSRDIVTLLQLGAVKSQSADYSTVTECDLSNILRPYQICPTLIRIDSQVRRGYLLTDFHDALERYVPVSARNARLEAITRRFQLENEAELEAQKIAENVTPLSASESTM